MPTPWPNNSRSTTSQPIPQQQIITTLESNGEPPSSNTKVTPAQTTHIWRTTKTTITQLNMLAWGKRQLHNHNGAISYSKQQCGYIFSHYKANVYTYYPTTKRATSFHNLPPPPETPQINMPLPTLQIHHAHTHICHLKIRKFSHLNIDSNQFPISQSHKETHFTLPSTLPL